jgi:aspartate carbamoyltransferase regulatory subunit
VNFKILGVILITLLAITMVSGCISQTSTDPQSTYNKSTIVCKNPDCPYHNPNSMQKDIDMEIDPMGYRWYLCQYCGERWREP